MTVGLVHPSFSLPEGKAGELIFFALPLGSVTSEEVTETPQRLITYI